MANFEGMKVVVTGADGFIGSRLVARLAAEGAEVVASVRFPDALKRLSTLNGGFDIKSLDVSVEKDVSAFFDKCGGVDCVFHLAAFMDDAPSVENVVPATRVNLAGTVNLLCACKEAGVGRFIFLGSVDEYGAGSPISENAPLLPITPYAASKAAATLYCLLFNSSLGLPSVVLRPFSVYGPGQSPNAFIPSALWASFCKAASFGVPRANRECDFVYVDDVVDAIISAAQSPRAPGNVFNVGTGIPTPKIRAAQLAFKLAGSSTIAVPKPDDRAKTGREAFFAGVSKAESILGWNAKTSLENGLEKTVNWFYDAYSNVKMRD